MATQLKSLKINRVDLVPEGANSAAYITLYKGKEGKLMEFEEILEKMKPEHADVIKAKFAEIEAAKAEVEEELAKAKECPVCGKAHSPFCVEKATDEDDDDTSEEKPEDEDDDVTKDTKSEGTASFDEDETLLKSLPPEAQKFISSLNERLAAAEEFAKSAAAREKHAEAVKKAADLKALPIDTDTLVATIEKSDAEFVDILAAIAKGIENTVLVETGSNEAGSFSKSADDAFEAMSQAASKIAKERGVTEARGMALVMEEQPELYKEYLKSLEGGSN